MLIASYRGRLAPSPTGYLHLGHARTFWIAWQRARAAGGRLVFRNEDLDYQRCRPEFVAAMYEDLRWLGLDWDEGPDISGPYAPYSQSERREFYLAAWRRLRDRGMIYPCTCSRKDLERALSAPHEEPQSPWTAVAGAAFARSGVEPGAAALHSPPDDEVPYPGTCRNKIATAKDYDSPAGVSWRLRVPDGESISFDDGFYGPQQFVAGRDFADFLLWRRDGIPAYQLAVVADDAAMQITEVVRGADLIKSTARQLLLIRALGFPTPAYFHCPLLRDERNVRLAKRHDALSLRTLREQGVKPEELRERVQKEMRDLLQSRTQ
ncbi:MAG TPA: tRNA glutamyl-Q(34) synthetase GluQRS [Candidatus Angelobacter sp.]|nr:tRNA glutamyl-Q(34) synthetase GluQRS [Candidatus Angelobacter sp.]